jgi:3-oxoacyl-[acyl-carrier protein] reductase
MRLKGKVAVVTGGGRGIGRAIVLAMAREGADLFLTYRTNETQASAVVREVNALGRRCVMARYDALEKDANTQLLRAMSAAYDRVDVLVNNAGVFEPKAFLEVDRITLDNLFDVNFFAPFELTQMVSRWMIDKKLAGSIVNILSATWERPRRGVVHYSASKAALAMLTKGAAAELACHNIRVNAVSPGLIVTDMTKSLQEDTPDVWQTQVGWIPLGRPGLPREVAGAVVFLASEEASFATGSVIALDGGRTIS